MKDKSALTRFALVQIPLMLKRRGGEMDKTDLHTEIEREFAGGQVLPAGLERVEASGAPSKTNAIAWAMAHLVMQKTLEPSAGKPTVRLTRRAMIRFGMA